MDEVRSAIARLYDVFERYPLKREIECCAHCGLDAAERQLHARPLRELTWEDLGVFPFKAVTTFGDEDDLRHFLPRMLELFVEDLGGSRYDVSVILRKLAHAGWDAWPEKETRAIREFVRSFHRFLKARTHEADEENWALEDLEGALADPELGWSEAWKEDPR